MNVADFGVELTAEQKDQIREVAEQRAGAARALKGAILKRFEGNKRVGVDTLAAFLDDLAAEMDAAVEATA